MGFCVCLYCVLYFFFFFYILVTFIRLILHFVATIKKITFTVFFFCNDDNKHCNSSYFNHKKIYSASLVFAFHLGEIDFNCINISPINPISRLFPLMNLQKFYVVKLPLPMWNFEIFDVVNFILLRLPFSYSTTIPLLLHNMMHLL